MPTFAHCAGLPDVIDLAEVRELLELDRQYYSSNNDGLLREMISKAKVAGKQVLARPALILDVVQKFELKACWVPDRIANLEAQK